MNIVLQDIHGDRRYFVISVEKCGLQYSVRSRKIEQRGTVWNVLSNIVLGTYHSLSESKKRVRTASLIKTKTGHYERVNPDVVPERYLAPPIDQQVTPEKLVEMIASKSRERYVVFADVTGMEEFFDVDVEYLANVVAAEPDLLDVFDKFGDCRHVMKSRFKSVDLTEDARLTKQKVPNVHGDANLIMIGMQCPYSLKRIMVGNEYCKKECKYFKAVRHNKDNLMFVECLHSKKQEEFTNREDGTWCAERNMVVGGEKCHACHANKGVSQTPGTAKIKCAVFDKDRKTDLFWDSVDENAKIEIIGEPSKSYRHYVKVDKPNKLDKLMERFPMAIKEGDACPARMHGPEHHGGASAKECGMCKHYKGETVYEVDSEKVICVECDFGKSVVSV